MKSHKTTASIALTLIMATALIVSAENPNSVPASPGGVDRITASMPTNCSADYLELVELADSAVAHNEWNRAIGLLTDAMRLEPSNPQNVMLLQNVGMMHFYSGRDSLAIATLSDAHAIAPASSVILNNRARVLLTAGFPADAIADYSTVLAHDASNTDALYGRATAYLYTDSLQQALADVKQLNALRPADLDASLLGALVRSQAADYDGAIELWTQIIDSCPTADYYAARALNRLLIDDLGAAADDIALGLQLDPEYAELYFCRAYLNKLRYRIDDAGTDAKRALQLGADPKRIAALGL